MGAPKGNKFAVGNKGGRPSKYNSEMLDQAKHYLENYQEYKDVIPSIAGLSLALDIVTSTIYDWGAQPEKKEFSDILAKIIDKQHNVLIQKGLEGEFNSNIAKLVLGKHGYHEKKDHNLGGDPNNPIKIEKSQIEFVVPKGYKKK